MKTLCLTFIALGLSAPFTSAQRREAFGAYQDCPFHCRTIQVRRDHTFVYRLHGDLYNDERIYGTWRYLDGESIRATSPEDQSQPRVEESRTGDPSVFRVTVTDEQGAVVHGATVRSVGTGSAVAIADDGAATIPRCDGFEIHAFSYRSQYRPSDSSSNSFNVLLSAAQLGAVAIDETWVIKGGRLYIVADDGTVNWDSYLEKLPPERERRIFGN